jgi:hypothetical protein
MSEAIGLDRRTSEFRMVVIGSLLLSRRRVAHGPSLLYVAARNWQPHSVR